LFLPSLIPPLRFTHSAKSPTAHNKKSAETKDWTWEELAKRFNKKFKTSKTANALRHAYRSFKDIEPTDIEVIETKGPRILALDIETTHVMGMVEDSRGNIWFATLALGVVKYDGALMRTYLENDGLASNRVICAAEDRKGNIWFGTYDKGVTRYSPGIE